MPHLLTGRSITLREPRFRRTGLIWQESIKLINTYTAAMRYNVRNGVRKKQSGWLQSDPHKPRSLTRRIS